MADENEVEAPSIEEEKPAAPAAPTFVTAEAFAESQKANLAALAALKDSFETLSQRALATHGVAPVAPNAIEDASDEELETAIANGQGGAKVLRKLTAALEQRIERKFAARTNDLEQAGYNSLTALAGEVVKPGLKHYTRFKKEIDNYIAQMAPAAQANPMSLKMAHDIVVGQNFDTLVAEEREAATRQAANPAPKPGGANSRGAPAAQDTNFDTVFGADASAELAKVGRDADSFAKKLGYKDAKEYAELAAQQEKELYGNVH
jgi:hypothetical protein